jgi:hypothetical protein
MSRILHLWRWQATPEPDGTVFDGKRPEPLAHGAALAAARRRCRELPQQQPLYLSRAVSPASGRIGWFVTRFPLAKPYIRIAIR